MRIASVETWSEDLGLTRPYRIASRTVSQVSNVFVRIRTDDGLAGLGAGSPEESVTGESAAACRAALAETELGWLVGRDPRRIRPLCRELARRLPATPAARAAVDIALHDLWAQSCGAPLCDVLGRAHDALPTSITLGIRSIDESLREADEYLARGFRALKVKIGASLEEDVERLRKLRERAGPAIALRVDANEGYSRAQLLRFAELTSALGIELVEQPVPRAETASLRALPPALRDRVAVDEGLLDERDALALAAPPPACGVFVVKLMKSGGVDAALRISNIAEAAGVPLMWGCNDESRASIAAALHAALACPGTRYLDLDGSFDLARDVVRGGFVLRDGLLSVCDAPGLGLEPVEP